MRNVFGMSVITAVTAQNTLGVTDIHLIPLSTIEAQLKAIVADFTPNAVKIGMLGTTEIIQTVAAFLRRHPFTNVVIDPVMIAKGGASLLEQSAIQSMREQLLPLADVLTPNLPEAEALTGLKAEDQHSIAQIAERLQQMGAKTVIIKGGHQQNSESAVCQDFIFTPTESFVLERPRFNTAAYPRHRLYFFRLLKR